MITVNYVWGGGGGVLAVDYVTKIFNNNLKNLCVCVCVCVCMQEISERVN